MELSFPFKESKESDDTKSENPWLKNISEFLVDETSAEEEELLGEKVREEGEDLGETTPVVKITRDVKLVKVKELCDGGTNTICP